MHTKHDSKGLNHRSNAMYMYYSLLEPQIDLLLDAHLAILDQKLAIIDQDKDLDPNIFHQRRSREIDFVVLLLEILLNTPSTLDVLIHVVLEALLDNRPLGLDLVLHILDNVAVRIVFLLDA